MQEKKTGFSPVFFLLFFFEDISNFLQKVRDGEKACP